MENLFLQDEPKLVLEYPHKTKFNRIGFSSMCVFSIIILWFLKRLLTITSDLSDKLIIAIVLVIAPVLIGFMGYHHFINGIKLELYENELIKYYTYGSKGNSLLQFTCKLQDIEEISVKESFFNCSKLSIQIKNPVFHGIRDKQLKILKKVTIISDKRVASELMLKWQNSKMER